jgi:NADPH:quinone reductase-like Zn-dependent oxidoreductase
MRALRFHKFGDVSKLIVEEVPDPVPGPGEIVVRVRAASVNPSDVKNVEGKIAITTLLRTPGRDFAGIVVDGPPSLRNIEVWGTGGDVGFTRDGTHAEFIVIPADAAVPKPANLSFEEAACVGTTFVTAYEGLLNRAKVKEGELVLVTGARGGVGSAVLELARAFGAKSIAVGRGPSNADRSKDDNVIGYVSTTDKDWVDSVRKIAGDKGVNVAFDCVGGELFEPVLSTLGRQGRQVSITSVGTRRVSFDLLDFYHRSLTLLGVDSIPLTVSDSARILDSLRPLFEKGSLKPAKIARTGSLQDAPALYAYVLAGRGGKAVIVFG